MPRKIPLVGAILVGMFTSIGVLGAELYVGPGGYSKIQAAIDVANPGDKIIVAAGTYQENLNITKPITISGVAKDQVILQPASPSYGIGVSGPGNNVTIENITINAGNAQNFLIHVSSVSNFTIQNVKVIGAGKTVTPGGNPLGGIDLNAVSGATISNVEVMDVSRNGVALTNSTEVTLENIYIHDTGVSEGWAGVAIYTRGGSSSATFSGTNTIVNTPMGVYVEDSPGATVNVIAPPGTISFSGQTVAPLLKLGQGNTPDLETTAQGLGLVVKVYAPEAPIPANTGVAYCATLDEALRAAVTDDNLAQYSVVFDLNRKLFVVGPGMQIQRALNATQDGDVVLVKAGEYVTQSVINKSIVLMGEPGAVVKAPGSQTYTIAESGATFDPIIFAYGGTLVGSHVSGTAVVSADVKDLTIDGLNKAPAYPVRFVGILYRNVDGTISGNTICNMYDSDGKGDGPETFGILVYGDSEVDVLSNVVSGFSRGGIGIIGDAGSAPDPKAHVEGNIVTGNGLETSTGWWAENGIQIGYGATGEILGNRVTACRVNSPYWAATGILVVDTHDVVVADNYVGDCDTGIGVVDFPGAIYGSPWNASEVNNVEVRGNTLEGNDYALDIANGVTNIRILYNVFSGNIGDAIDVYDYSIWYPAYTIPAPTGVVIHYNSISRNGGDGLWVAKGVTALVDATLNWWGSPNGPDVDLDANGMLDYAGGGDSITGMAAFSPWLGSAPDGDPNKPGVQITGPVLIVVAPVGPEPAAGYLNTAIQGANELPYADTIEVRGGTYNVSTPVTGPVTIVSEPGSASHTTLTGSLSLRSGGVIIGAPLRGFTINGNVTVESLVDAASSRINWCNLYGTVTNNGIGTFDARYNYWGTLSFADIDARTIGDVAVDPYLPEDADNAYLHVVGLIGAGVAANVDHAIDHLWVMHRLGMDVSTYAGYVGAAGGAAFRTGLPGAGIAGGAGGLALEGEVAGGAGALGLPVYGVFKVGDPVAGHFGLTDPLTGKPLAYAAVAVTLTDVSGKVVYWGAAAYDPATGEYKFNIDTSKLSPGTYTLIVQEATGEPQTFTIELLPTE